jgi:hypothetical protein
MKERSPAVLDLSRLELDFLEQTPLMRNAVSVSAKAKNAVAHATRELEVVKAKTKMKVRANPGKFGIPNGKPTKDQVDDALTLSEVYQLALQKVHDAQFAVDKVAGHVKWLDDRRRTIEGLITLHGQGYWAKPKVSKTADDSFRGEIDHHEKAKSRKATKRK